MSLQPPVYRQAALDKHRSPLALDDVPRLTPLRAWIGLAALACLTAALLLWGVFGKLTTQIDTEGMYDDGILTLSLDAARVGEIHPGLPVRALCSGVETTGNVQAITYDNEQEQFEITVALGLQRAPSMPCSATIIVREERPITRLFPLR